MDEATREAKNSEDIKNLSDRLDKLTATVEKQWADLSSSITHILELMKSKRSPVVTGSVITQTDLGESSAMGLTGEGLYRRPAEIPSPTTGTLGHRNLHSAKKNIGLTFTAICGGRSGVTKTSSQSDGRPRPALADLNNHTRKWVFEAYVGKVSDGRENGDNLQGSKEVCLALESLGMEKNHNNYSSENRLSNVKTVGFRKDLVIWESAVGQSNVKAGIVAGSDYGNRVTDLDGWSRDYCCSIPLIHVGSESCSGERISEEILLGRLLSALKNGSAHENKNKETQVASHKMEPSSRILGSIGVASYLPRSIMRLEYVVYDRGRRWERQTTSFGAARKFYAVGKADSAYQKMRECNSVHSGPVFSQGVHVVPVRLYAKEAAPTALKGDEMLKNIFPDVKNKFEIARGVFEKEKITIDPDDPAAVDHYAREKAGLVSESQRIKYTIETRTAGIHDARTHLLTLKEIRVKRGIADELGADATMRDALEKVEKELKKFLVRNDKKGMSLFMVVFNVAEMEVEVNIEFLKETTRDNLLENVILEAIMHDSTHWQSVGKSFNLLSSNVGNLSIGLKLTEDDFPMKLFTTEFMEALQASANLSIIRSIGVDFCSDCMVVKKSFTITGGVSGEQFCRGTKITRSFKGDQLEFLEERRRKNLRKKHSEFSSYPKYLKELPMITANTIMSTLSIDYSVEKMNYYVLDDGASRSGAPFCKRYSIEPWVLEFYFNQAIDYMKDKVEPSFVKESRGFETSVDGNGEVGKLVDIVIKMNARLESEKIMSSQWCYTASDRIPLFIGLPGEGFKRENLALSIITRMYTFQRTRLNDIMTHLTPQRGGLTTVVKNVNYINSQLVGTLSSADFDAEMAEIRASIVNEVIENGETALYTIADRAILKLLRSF